MQRIFLILSFLLLSSWSFGQDVNFTIDLEVGSLKYKNDFVKFSPPNIFSINTTGCTEIFSLGKARRHEFGMKVEILASHLTVEKKFLVGKVYYIKKNGGQWEEIMKIEHQETDILPFALRERTDMFITGGGSTDYPELFDVHLNDNYYRNQ